jgi:hypothetical protein
MSKPRNHHYVSRALTQNFTDANGKVPYYDKERDFFAVANSTKSIFSEEDLNTTKTKTGEIDYTSIEETLNRYFEQDFPKYFKKMTEALKSDGHTHLTESIEYLMRIGIIGNMRTREHQIETENAIFGSFDEITRHATDELRASFEHFMQSLTGVKNKLGTDFKELADRIKETMGEVIYSVFLAPENDYFILPDCTSAIHRAQLEDDVIHNGEVLKPIGEPIATVILPVSSKIVLVSQAKKICPQEQHGIYNLSSEVLYSYNKLFFEQAHKKVACQDKVYLYEFVARIKQDQLSGR